MISLPSTSFLRDETPPPRLICPTCQKQCASDEAYRRHVGKHASHSSSTSSDESLEGRDLDSNEDEPELLPTQCLFCNLDSLTLEENIDHMYLRHGLFIPEPARIIDMETFLTYLAALVFRYTECLYCGLQKGSRQGVQAHMRDKGHCMINTDAESELFDFWVVPGSDDDDAGEPPRAAKAPIVKVSDTELLLPSGAILGPRADRLQGRQRPSHTEAGKRARVKALAIENGTADARPSNDRRVAVRGEQGLIGVSDQQRRALMVVEKKMMKREAVARSAQRWATERVANKQKFFRPDVPGRSNG